MGVYGLYDTGMDKRRLPLVEDGNMYLRLGQAAARLGVSPETVRRWIDKKRLRAIRLPTTGERRVLESEIEQLLRSMETDRPREHHLTHFSGRADDGGI